MWERRGRGERGRGQGEYNKEGKEKGKGREWIGTEGKEVSERSRREGGGVRGQRRVGRERGGESGQGEE